MNGIELSERYFFEAGLPLLRERYPQLVERVAAGLVAGGAIRAAAARSADLMMNCRAIITGGRGSFCS